MMSVNENLNRFSDLFDLASQDSIPLPAGLTEAEKVEIEYIRAVLNTIDAAWQISETKRQRVRSLFLQKIAVQNPNHPWVRDNMVHTLGQLVERSSEDAPNLPTASRQQLMSDSTPIELLIDPKKRTKVAGQAARRAEIPLTLIGEFMLWLNGVLADLISPPTSQTKGLIFTRRQGRQREK